MLTLSFFRSKINLTTSLMSSWNPTSSMELLDKAPDTPRGVPGINLIVVVVPDFNTPDHSILTKDDILDLTNSPLGGKVRLSLLKVHNIFLL